MDHELIKWELELEEIIMLMSSSSLIEVSITVTREIPSDWVPDLFALGYNLDREIADEWWKEMIVPIFNPVEELRAEVYIILTVYGS